MKKLLTILLALILTGCQTTTIETSSNRATTEVMLTEYNSLAGKYLDKSTFLSISGNTLTYKADRYGQGYLWLVIHKNDIDTVFGAIDKYLRWESLAVKNGEMLTKDLTQKYNSESAVIDYKFVFHSGNAATHYMQFSSDEITFSSLSKDNVLRLKNELIKWRDGTLKFTTAEDISKYN